MEPNCCESWSEHADSSRRTSDTSDQTKTTALQKADENCQAEPDHASSVQFQRDCVAHGDDQPKQAAQLEKNDEGSGNEPEMNGVALSPTNQTVEGDDKTRIRALEQQLQQFQSEFQQFRCQFQQLQIQNESEKEKNEQLQKYVQSLESKLESHGVVQNGPWSKMFQDPTESKSSPAPKSAKTALKKICQKKCQGTGTKRETICAHVWPNHAWKKLKEMFNDKYNIHGEENLLLLCKDVEREFDAGRICLVLGVLQNGDKYFKVKVLNKDTGKTHIGRPTSLSMIWRTAFLIWPTIARQAPCCRVIRNKPSTTHSPRVGLRRPRRRACWPWPTSARPIASRRSRFLRG